jgi:hypothetical protein
MTTASVGLSQVEDKQGSLRHLFGSAALVAALCLVVFIVVSHYGEPPKYPPIPSDFGNDAATIKDLFDNQLKDYKAALAILDANLSAQALVVVTAILVIIRRSDSLNFFGNSIPLSWLHVFIPILLVYLFMALGSLVSG